MSAQLNWRLVVVLAAFTQFFVTAGPVYNYNVFFVDLREEFNRTALYTGWVGSLGSALHCAVVPLAAVAASHVGDFPLVIIGTLVTSAGYLATSFIPSLVYGYLTFGVMAGVGSSLGNCAAGSLVLDWYSGQEGSCRATAGAILGTSFGVMVFGPLLNTLSDIYGWRNCFRILSGIVFILGMASSPPYLSAPEKHQTHGGHTKEDTDRGNSCQTKAEPAKEERGTAAASNLDVKPSGRSKDPDITDRATDPATATVSPPGGPVTTNSDSEKENPRAGHTGNQTHPLKLFLNVEIWIWVASITFAQFGWSFVILNFASFMEGIGLSTEQISLSLLVFGASEVGIKIVFALFGDRLPCLKLYMIVASSLGGAIVSGFLTLCSTFSHMIIFAAAWGFFRGAMYGSCMAAGDELFSMYGSRTVTSIVLLGFGLGVLASPIIDGIYDLTGEYTLSLFVLVGSFLMSAVCILLIPARRKLPFCQRSCRRASTPPAESANSQAVTCHSQTPVIGSMARANPAYEVEV